MANFKVAILHTLNEDISLEENLVKEAGGELIVNRGTGEDSMIAAGKDADALTTTYAEVGEKVLSACKNAKGIVRSGIGFNNIDIKAASKLGIYVANVPDYCWDEVSDHAIALAQALVRGIGRFDKRIRSGEWSVQKAPTMLAAKGRTFALMGFGNIPKHVAKKVQAFGYNVIAYDPFVSQEAADEYNVRMVDLETMFKEADVLSIHAPLMDATFHVVNEEHLKMMKKTAFVVNTSRGPLVDEKALYKALSEGWIAGAGLDVMEQEPPEKDNPLLTLENILITPHAAYSSDVAEIELRRKTILTAIEMAKGNAPKAWVNRREMEANK